MYCFNFDLPVSIFKLKMDHPFPLQEDFVKKNPLRYPYLLPSHYNPQRKQKKRPKIPPKTPLTNLNKLTNNSQITLYKPLTSSRRTPKEPPKVRKSQKKNFNISALASKKLSNQKVKCLHFFDSASFRG